MPNNQVRIIIDTNLWISFLLNKDSSKLDLLLLNNKVRLVFSQELLSEFLEVVQRPKFKKYFTISDIRKILTTIDEFADFVRVTSDIKLCRDIKDNFLLSLSIDGAVDFLLTGDHDLLELKVVEKTQIMQLSVYLSSY